MRPPHPSFVPPLLGALAASVLVLGCNQGMGAATAGGTTDSPVSGNAAASDSGTTVTPASSPLMCAPSSAQTSACSGKAVGDTCALAHTFRDRDGDSDDDAGVRTIAGTCRSTLDGASVACVPVPPTALTQPCSGKSTGDACQAQGPFGGMFEGACVDRSGSGTLICGRVFMPPQRFIDACTGKATGDGCAIGERRDGGSISGVCGNGPTGTGPLACAPNRDRAARLAVACTGLDAGATCRLGNDRWGIEGTCTIPAGGSAAQCLVPCPELGHRMRHGPW